MDGEGRPYAVPVSQAAWPEGECIYFHCAIGGKKYEIFENGCEAVMSAVSRTEIVLGQYTVAYASAIARGHLEIIADPEERMHAMAVLCRQFDLPPGRSMWAVCSVWAQGPAWCAWLWRRSPEKRAWAKIK